MRSSGYSLTKTFDKASSISGNSFSGSLGYQRTASDFDNSDYFVYEQSAKGELCLNTTINDTLASQYTTLYIYDSGNESITYFYLMSTNTTNYVSLAYGTTYYIQLFSGLNNLYGAYSVDLSFTPDTTTVPDTSTTTVPDSTTTTTTTISDTLTTTTTATDCGDPDEIFCEGECCVPDSEFCCDDHCCSSDGPGGLDEICCGDTCCSYWSDICFQDKCICCFIVPLYGKYSEEAELLRDFRDSVLSQTPVGEEIIELYYQWSPAIAKAMEEDGEFKEEVKEMIDGVLMLIGRVE